MTTPLLCLDKLACRRGERLLWRGLDLALAAGDAVHISGANGCGKSSLLRIVAGFLPPAAGAVRCAVRAALFDEAHALDADVPLRKALGFWQSVHDSSVSVEATLDIVGLSHLADVPLRLFSTGQKKRAALARTLLAQAPLWLLDEPANGLDQSGVTMLETVIAQHRAGGGALLYASHQPLTVAGASALALADYAA